MNVRSRSRTLQALASACLICASTVDGRSRRRIEPVRPAAPIVVRPYHAAGSAAGAAWRIRNACANLVRAGKLYLTAQDAIALALENNIDIEVAATIRSFSAWQLERAQAGGALPGVPSGASQAGSVASGQGVAGSQAAAGVSVSGANGAPAPLPMRLSRRSVP